MHPVTGSARLRKPEYDHAAATEGEDLTGLSDVMRVTAEEAGAILMEGFGLPHTLEGKEGREFLTEADLRSQEHIRTRLEGACPGAVFVGEEGACVAIPDGSPFWLVDPLDGTANYAHGFPFFSVSIAFSDGRSIVAGCVHDPVRRETFTAGRGEGAFLFGGVCADCGDAGPAGSPERIEVSGARTLDESILATGFPYRRSPGDLGFDVRPLLHHLGRVRGIRRTGSAALDLCYVACGRLDGYWEEHLRPWDMAAGALAVEEAGGRILGWDRMPWSTRSGGIIAAAPGIMQAVLDGIVHPVN